jgi:hypothetical protein
MTFVTVLGRTLKRLSFFWQVYKDPSKVFKARALVFIFSLMFLLVWIPMDYFLAFKPYKDVTYPPISKMNVDNGTWVFAHKRGEYSYLLTQDGKKILFDGNWKLGHYHDELCKSVGMSPLSEYCPDIHAKIWWYPKVHSNANEIGQIEVDRKIIASYEEGRELLKKLQDHSDDYATYSFLLMLMTMAFLWELIVQYIKYRQENN